MTVLRLVVEISASNRVDARRLAGRIEQEAETAFEDETMKHGRPMSMTTRFEKAAMTPSTVRARREDNG